MYELDLHRLNVFYTVVNEGTLSKAGERLFMSQPAISAHIKALEQQLGVRLFDRIGRRSVVNKAGELLYKKAEELFTVADDLKACMEDLRGVSNGRLTIGVSMDWQYRLPRALGRFKQEYPGVELSMEIGDSDRIEKMVMERSLDVGFVVNESSRAELASEHVAADELVPICSANHRLAGRKKLAVSELADEKFVVRESDSATRRLTDELLERHELDHNISMEMGSNEAIKSAVMTGEGIGIVSKQALESELHGGLIAILDAPDLKAPLNLYIVYHTQRKTTLTQTAFMEMVTSNGLLSEPLLGFAAPKQNGRRGEKAARVAV